MPADDETFRRLLDTLDRRPEAREELRRRLLPGDGTEQALRELAQAQTRTEHNLAVLTARVDGLAERVGDLAGEVHNLVGWQKGVKGLQEGTRYQERTVRRGADLFQGGRGGSTTEPWLREQVDDLLSYLPMTDLDPKDDPLLADIIWWKDGAYALVEIGRTVDRGDIERAHDRAQTLRGAGAARGVHSVLPLVFGDDWANTRVTMDDQELSLRQLAERLGVGWRVGDDWSPSFIEYRKLPSGG